MDYYVDPETGEEHYSDHTYGYYSYYDPETNTSSWYDGPGSDEYAESWGFYDGETGNSDYYSTLGDYYSWYDGETGEWGWYNGEDGTSGSSEDYMW